MRPIARPSTIAVDGWRETRWPQRQHCLVFSAIAYAPTDPLARKTVSGLSGSRRSILLRPVFPGLAPWVALFVILKKRLLDFLVNMLQPLFRAKSAVTKMSSLGLQSSRSLLGLP